jgi:hypothetical protein
VRLVGWCGDGAEMSTGQERHKDKHDREEGSLNPQRDPYITNVSHAHKKNSKDRRESGLKERKKCHLKCNHFGLLVVINKKTSPKRCNHF